MEQSLIEAHSSKQKKDAFQQCEDKVDHIQNTCGLSHTWHKLAHCWPGDLRPHDVDIMISRDRQNCSDEHKNAHSPDPMGKESPEHAATTEPLGVAQDAGSRGRKTGDRFKKGIQIVRNIAGKDKGKRTEHGHQHPGEAYADKAFPRKNIRRPGFGRAQPSSCQQQNEDRPEKG